MILVAFSGLDLKLNGEPSIALDGRPYLSMGYTNGPGYTYHRTNGTLSEEIPGRRNLTEDSKEGKLSTVISSCHKDIAIILS